MNKTTRTRGPSQPQIRNKSQNKIQMNQTLNSFKMGHGQVESDKTDFSNLAHTQREKFVQKLQPLAPIKTPKIYSTSSKPGSNNITEVHELDQSSPAKEEGGQFLNVTVT